MDAGLISRIAERLRDDARRTGDGDYLRLPKEIRDRNRPRHLLYGPLWSAMHKEALAGLQPLKPIEPLGEAAVAKTEKALGFRLPEELRQLYLELGDGGFGPFNGVRRLSNWAKDYERLRVELPVERGREWPEGLLPIVYRNGKRLCVDRASGAVLLWTKPPKRASAKAWLASFVPQSPSLGEWLERWVDTPTEAEGGPEGGWAPPDEETARREQAEREKAERRAKEFERARTIAHAELPPLADDLLQRIRARALDPDRRTYFAGARRTPLDLETIGDELEDKMDVLPPNAAAGLVGLFKAVKRLSAFVDLPGFDRIDYGGGAAIVQRGTAGRLGAPATDAALAHAAARLGFPLPAPLVQLYRIADGGFGPGDGGLLSLARMIETWRKLAVDDPKEPAWKPWPARRLPLFEQGSALGCLDLETGRIGVYEILGMDYPSSRDWRRCDEAWDSLPALMEHWLGRRTFEERQALRAARSGR